MKVEFKKLSLITIMRIIASITALVFAGLSFKYYESWVLRIILQANMFLIFLIWGIETILCQKRIILGFLLIGVCVLITSVMIKTIFVGRQLGIW